MKTFASLLTGFDGVGIGAKAVGMEVAWGVEIEPELAEVANANLGGHVKVGDVLDQDPYKFDWVNFLHLSPVCKNASAANQSAEVNEEGLKETALDIAVADKCCQFIDVLRPDVVTIENVWGYRKFQSWRGGRKTKGLQQTLYDAGYWLNIEIVNSADYGVPQTRKRMIVRAIRGGFVPYLPQPVPWVGWYAAIEDILHTLPESQFADWQLARLPEELRTMLVAQGKYGDDLVLAQHDKPSFAITANSNQLGLKTFIMDSKNSVNYGNPPAIRYVDDPMFPIVASQAKGMPRAFDGGRVVAMTPRALARFQSFPDSYMLPDSKTLAAKGIGNAVPPLMYQKIVEGLLS